MARSIACARSMVSPRPPPWSEFSHTCGRRKLLALRSRLRRRPRSSRTAERCFQSGWNGPSEPIIDRIRPPRVAESVSAIDGPAKMSVSSASRLHTVDLGGRTPVEVAAGLAHLPGLVFFDSARECATGSSVSIVSADPGEVIRGRIDADWDRLRAAVRNRSVTSTGDFGLPIGFAAGCVEYNGSYEFGLYDHALYYDHRAEQWLEFGALSTRLHNSSLPAKAATLQFTSEMDREGFVRIVKCAQEYIAAGDI